MHPCFLLQNGTPEVIDSALSFCRMDSGSGVGSSGKVEGGSEESTGLDECEQG